jgi:hypothetical protein
MYVMKLTRSAYILGEFISRALCHERCAAFFIHPATGVESVTQGPGRGALHLASGPLIAENTATIPSPYTLEVAHAFIG